MREILFRGKRKGSGEWVEGSYHNVDGKYLYILVEKLDITQRGSILIKFPVDPETVGQYVLKDKNGVKVFEGDIVLLDEDVKETFRAKDGSVLFCRGAFFIGDADRILNCIDVLADYNGRLRGEVIGNICDNPELLEEGGEE